MSEKTQPPAPRKLSTANTKQEMLSAYNEVLKELQEKRQAEPRPEERIEQRVTADAVKVAEELSTEGVVKQVGELRSTIGRLLSQVASQLEEQVDRYAQISKAIAFKEKELAEIYEIQKSALALAALIQAQQQKREQFEEEMTRQKEELAGEIAEARAAWEQDRKRYESEIKERDSAESKRRKREEEEYRYAFAREQQLARDAFADEKARGERELALRQEQAQREQEERERALAAREQELTQLRQRVEGFPKELQAAVATAAREATARAEADAIARIDLQQREFAGERNVLTTRIGFLEQSLREQGEQLARLTQQSEKAYGQVQEIAVRAIEGSSSFKSMASLQQLLGEQQRKQGQEK
jgi:hypothetical protein